MMNMASGNDNSGGGYNDPYSQQAMGNMAGGQQSTPGAYRFTPPTQWLQSGAYTNNNSTTAPTPGNTVNTYSFGGSTNNSTSTNTATIGGTPTATGPAPTPNPTPTPTATPKPTTGTPTTGTPPTGGSTTPSSSTGITFQDPSGTGNQVYQQNGNGFVSGGNYTTPGGSINNAYNGYNANGLSGFMNQYGS